MAPDKRKTDKDVLTSALRTATLCTQLGLSLAVPIVFGLLIGNWIDKKLGTGPIFMVVLLLLGTAAGISSSYRQIKGLVMVPDKKNKNEQNR